MGTEVLKSFNALQFELEQAKSSLKNVDENIKKLIGRDPSENPNRTSNKRSNNTNHNEENRNRPNRGHNNSNFSNNNRNKSNFENDEPPAKKRNVESNVFKRLSDRPVRHYDEEAPESHSKQLISRVIVTPKEQPSRQDVLAAQSADKKSKERNRRMFGALLGTLQKFRQEETKLKPKEEKRAQVEKKLEEQQIKEREELKKERQDLFLNRKKKQAEIRMIELKMTRMKEYSEWEEKHKPLVNFIQTKAKPHIYFLPKILNDQNKKLLETCKTNVEKMIEKKRQDVFDELAAIENRMKKNFDKQQGSTEDDKHNDFLDPDQEDHLHDNEDHEADHHIESTVTKIEEDEAPAPIDHEVVNSNEIKSEVRNDDVTEPIETKDSVTENVDSVENESVEETEVKQNVDETVEETKEVQNKMDDEIV